MKNLNSLIAIKFYSLKNCSKIPRHLQKLWKLFRHIFKTMVGVFCLTSVRLSLMPHDADTMLLKISDFGGETVVSQAKTKLTEASAMRFQRHSHTHSVLNDQ